MPAIIGDHSGKSNNARAIAVIFIFADLGSILGPMVGLSLLDASLFSIKELYRLCALMILLGASVSLTISRKNQRAIVRLK